MLRQAAIYLSLVMCAGASNASDAYATYLDINIPDPASATGASRVAYCNGTNNNPRGCIGRTPVSDAKYASHFLTSATSSGQATAKLESGDLKARLESYGNRNNGVIVVAYSDTLHYTPVSTPTLIPISVHLSGILNNAEAEFTFGQWAVVGGNVESSMQFQGYYQHGGGYQNVDLLAGARYGTGIGWTRVGPSDMTGSFLLNPGVTDVTIFAALSLYLNNSNLDPYALADFSHTASVRIHPPEGITFTSSSGVFLTAVPEPTSWMMLVGGLALLWGVKQRNKDLATRVS